MRLRVYKQKGTAYFTHRALITHQKRLRMKLSACRDLSSRPPHFSPKSNLKIYIGKAYAEFKELSSNLKEIGINVGKLEF
ncbi:MAG: hypothetical protein OHK0023_05080 [Anaerolineae bacterium]